MSEGNRIFVGDIGTTFNVEIGTPLAEASKVEFRVEKPSGAIVVWPGTITDEDGGYAEYVAVIGDLDEVGVWKLSSEVTMLDGSFYHGCTSKFTVYEQFD